jgi:energy-coupling factor transporter transmembrane protein EcfT
MFLQGLIVVFVLVAILMLVGSLSLKKSNKRKNWYILASIVAIFIIVLVIFGYKNPFAPSDPPEPFENKEDDKKKIDHFAQEILKDAENNVVDATKIAQYIQDGNLTKEGINSIIQSLGNKSDEKDKK